MSKSEPSIQHRVKTYVRRESRITRAQRRALEQFSSQYLIATDDRPIDLQELFPEAEKIEIELGFGTGESLVHLASKYKSRGYLGVEVYRPGVGKCLLNLQRLDLKNVRILTIDARDVLEKTLQTGTVDTIYILFPDPWPKRRHRKRRLITPEFLDLCASRLTGGGKLNIATDCEDYAVRTLNCLQAHQGFVNADPDDGFYTGVLIRSQTVYEKKALQKGCPIYEILFDRQK